VDTSLRDDVHVKAVTQVDRVDVVAFQVRVHDGEEDLQEKVDGIDQDREEEQPGRVLATVYVAGECRSLSYHASPVILAVLVCGNAKSGCYGVS
jgi:hypothetical protein